MLLMVQKSIPYHLGNLYTKYNEVSLMLVCGGAAVKECLREGVQQVVGAVGVRHRGEKRGQARH